VLVSVGASVSWSLVLVSLVLVSVVLVSISVSVIYHYLGEAPIRVSPIPQIFIYVKKK
jgi:hypothetical protein